MTDSTDRPRTRHRARRYIQAALLLAVGVTAGLLAADALPPGQNAPPSTAAPSPPPGRARITGSVGTPHVQPSQLKIPAIDVRSRLVPLGLDGNGALQAPMDYRAVGWYAEGPAPGDAGGPPAVLAGHVDSTRGPAVFFRLRDLKKGDDVQIQGIDGKTRHFKVYRLADYTKSGFPAAQVYAPSDRAEIRLITCSGQFDQSRGGYRDNLVAYAALSRGGG